MLFIKRTMTRLAVFLSGSFLLAACSNSNDTSFAPPPGPPPPPGMASFDVTVTNLTNAQPLSPVAVIAHQDGYAVFTIGSPATDGLEQMAEGGDNATLLAEANADAMVVTSASGAAPIGPGGSETVTINLLESELAGLRISVATMLVNTNDAFSGLNSEPAFGFLLNQSVSRRSIAYDAGTEADSETAATIPGPAGGGEGFNAARDDEADRVSMHPGIVSQDDGLASSDLTGQHRFDNPVATISIVRTD